MRAESVSISAMIVGVPTPEQFHDAGVDYLLMAFEELLSLLTSAEGYAELEEHEAGLVAKHWTASNRKLATSGTLIYQGAEFLLKSRIAKVSPYLLLDGGKETWTSAAAKTDTEFSTFRTVDAQLLTKIHDATHSERLTVEFKALLEGIRVRRNAATHSLSAAINMNAGLMIVEILEISHNLLGEYAWPRAFRDKVYGEPAPWADYHGTMPRYLLESWRQTVSFLTDSQFVRYLGFSKKVRRYACPTCHTGDLPPEPSIKLAHLRPNSPSSTAIYCFVCDQTSDVVRRPCEHCKGNVIDDYPGHCLSCDRRTG